MTQEIKTKLQQAADKFAPIANECYEDNAGFLAGAKTILENPGEWGLMSINQHIKEMGHEAMAQDLMREDIEKFKAQNELYKGALERIYNSHNSRKAYFDAGLATNLEVNTLRIAKEALKQGEK